MRTVERGLPAFDDDGVVAVVKIGGSEVADPGVEPVLRGSAPEDEHGFVCLCRSGA